MGAKVVNMSDYESKRKSPQTEDGYTKIANELLDEFCKLDLKGGEFRTLFVIIRQTYGFCQKFNKISAQFIAEKTGLSLRYVRTAIKNLKLMGVIISDPDDTLLTGIKMRGDKRATTYGINKDYSTWCYDRSVIQPTPPKGDPADTLISDPADTLSGFLPLYERKHKKNVKKARKPPRESVILFADKFAKYVSENKSNAPRVTKGYLDNSVIAIEELINDFGYDLEYIRGALRWALEDAFWGKVAKTLPGLTLDKHSSGTNNFQKIADDYDRSRECQSDDSDAAFIASLTGPTQPKGTADAEFKKLFE